MIKTVNLKDFMMDTIKAVSGIAVSASAYTYRDFLADTTGMLGLISLVLICINYGYDIRNKRRGIKK